MDTLKIPSWKLWEFDLTACILRLQSEVLREKLDMIKIRDKLKKIIVSRAFIVSHLIKLLVSVSEYLQWKTSYLAAMS